MFQPGDLVVWDSRPRGGYGYVYPVNGVVVKIAKRVLIRVTRKDGTEAERWVSADALRRR